MMVKNGNFLNLLFDDDSVAIVVLVAKQCYSLKTLRNSISWEVKLEVYNQTNYEFMKFSDIHRENYRIKAKAVMDGNITFTSVMNDYLTVYLLMDEFPFCYSGLKGIFDTTTFKEIQIKAIKLGLNPEIYGDSINEHNRKKQVSTLLNDYEFVLYCIRENKFIDLIIQKYKDSSKVVVELLERGYAEKKFNIEKEDKEKKEHVLNEYAFENIKSKEILCSLISLGYFHNEIANTSESEYIIRHLINETSSVNALDAIKLRSSREMYLLSKNKLEDEAIMFNLSSRVKVL